MAKKRPTKDAHDAAEESGHPAEFTGPAELHHLAHEGEEDGVEEPDDQAKDGEDDKSHLHQRPHVDPTYLIDHIGSLILDPRSPFP